MRRVLFVDVQNNVRSPMAAAWFNRQSPYGYRGFSCGTIPASAVNPLAVQAMQGSGLDLSAHVPTRVSSQLLASADVIVLMATELGTRSLMPTYIWHFHDPTQPTLDHYLNLSNFIRRHVAQLVTDLKLLPFATSARESTAYSPGYRSRV